MSEGEDLSFLTCNHPDELSTEDREKYTDYWFARTPVERLEEVWRINANKFGPQTHAQMDKTRLEVIDLTKYSEGTTD